jgi:hypothetical protein
VTTLAAVKRYLESHGRATVPELAIGLGTTPDNARSLLEIWRAKQRVRVVPGGCGPCGKGLFGGCSCAMAAMAADVYEWVGRPGEKNDAA